MAGSLPSSITRWIKVLNILVVLILRSRRRRPVTNTLKASGRYQGRFAAGLRRKKKSTAIILCQKRLHMFAGGAWAAAPNIPNPGSRNNARAGQFLLKCYEKTRNRNSGSFDNNDADKSASGCN